MSSLTRRGSLERRSNTEKRRSWSPEDFGSSLDSFRPESDRLRDEDLYKFLQDLKRPCSVMKKLKCIPGTLKLDISPCPDELRYCLTTELARLNPYPGILTLTHEKGRPTKEILEFPLREVFTPHYSYRNLLYVYPKELNFGSRAGSARNIAVKVQLMCGEEDCDALPVIFGKSSCPEFTTEAYTTVSYHNKCPDFYDELKIKLPANLGDHHHLLFTFYHISCQRKVEPTTAETPVGFTWLPIYRDGRLQSGEFCLPVMIERPPPNYSFIPPDVLLPGTKWVDNHKGIFLVTLGAVSSVHTQDKYLDKFLNICAILQDGNIPARIGEANMENELKTSILELTHAKSEPLVKFLPLIMNKLVLLMVKPPTILGQAMNIGQTSFEAITMIVRNVTALQEGHHDQHGRHSLLTTYLSYQCMLPHPIQAELASLQDRGYTSFPSNRTKHIRSSSNPDIHNFVSGDDAEINSLMRGLDRTSSMRAGPSQENMLYGEPRSHPLKIAHEELALQWVVSSDFRYSGPPQGVSEAGDYPGRQALGGTTPPMFLFEMIVKSMVEHLAANGSLDAPRKMRFCEQFTDDVTTLVNTITSDIISRYSRDTKVIYKMNLTKTCLFIHSLNTSLAFFLFDVLSIMDRGYVFFLIKTYYKQMSAKISSLPDAASLVSLKQCSTTIRNVSKEWRVPPYWRPQGNILLGLAELDGLMTHLVRWTGWQNPCRVIGVGVVEGEGHHPPHTKQLEVCTRSQLGIASQDTSTGSPLGNLGSLSRETEDTPKAEFITSSSDAGGHNWRDQLLPPRASRFFQLMTGLPTIRGQWTQYAHCLDFLRIVCSHEHFVALNLPFGTPFTPSSAPASPSLSVSSSASQSSFISTLIGGDKMSFAELSLAFKQQHFLVGLVLSDLASVLEIPSSVLHSKAVNLVRNLMTCHDCDTRYVEMECKARVAALYLPLLGIIMDNLPQLYGYNSDQQESSGMWMKSNTEEIEPRSGINKSVAMAIAGTSTLHSKSKTPENYSTYQQSSGMWMKSNTEEIEPRSGINKSVAMAIAGTSTLHSKSKTPENYSTYQQNHKHDLSSETTRNLLICFLWVIKNVDKNVVKQWWMDLPTQRFQQLLEVLNIAISCFEYKGKKSIKHCAPQNLCKTSDIKSRLEDVILGQGSARSEMIMRRKERNPPSNGWPGDRLRWRKEQMAYRPSLDLPGRPQAEVETDAHIEGNLATEVSFVILDTLEQIVQVASQLDNLQCLLGVVLKVLLHALARNQSTCVLQNMFATQRSLVFKFPNLLFDEETEHCADLCLRLLKHCSSSMSSVRSQASASLYLLMRQNFEIGNNFARVKMQVTMSLSSLVGTSSSFSEESLRRSLKTILVYAEEDSDLQDTTFPEQVKDLVFNLHMILSDTVKMKEFQEDPEMLLDLMYRIAKGYQNSPDLRLTWLANMAQKHMERKNHTEAAMCLVHSAALVAEYLHMLEDQPQLPVGAVGLEMVSPNVLEESAVSDDVLSPEEEGVCLGNYFTESGLVGLLEQAASAFHSAGMYEALNEVYKILIPVAESSRDYQKLAHIHMKLHEAFARIEQLQGKRVFGTYFRVGFYGTKFGDLNGEEFIYKEPTLTKLPEIFSRLEEAEFDPVLDPLLHRKFLEAPGIEPRTSGGTLDSRGNFTK
ncbi:unnamed protein product, partial [Timema podura]|nr:unnamed protein product [Timema podura]